MVCDFEVEGDVEGIYCRMWGRMWGWSRYLISLIVFMCKCVELSLEWNGFF